MSLLITGSIALDSVKTSQTERHDLLGGSASYAAVAASFFTDVNLVGIVGRDFPREYMDLYRQRQINLDGLQIVEGATFRWHGEYEQDMNRRRTLSIALNVFEKFQPMLPAAYCRSPYIFLANIAPQLQLHVLDQVERPKFVVADTMDLWIGNARDALRKLLTRIDCLILNESEAREFTGQSGLIKAGKVLQGWGPRHVVIKKGEHGCLLFGPDFFFSAPAVPLEEIHDPTGAGDCFAGAFAGYLASQNRVDPATLRQAVIYGSIIASFNVESFSLDRLHKLNRPEIAERYQILQQISRFETA